MRLYHRASGTLRQWRGDSDGIAQAFAALPPTGAATLAAPGENGNALLLRRTADDAFRFRVVDRSGPEATGHRVGARRDFVRAARPILA